MVEVPDVTNKTIDEATKALNAAGLNIKVVGNGNAVKQSVEPEPKYLRARWLRLSLYSLIRISRRNTVQMYYKNVE